MQFQVPQFLDIEDKIIGPFTMKQFLYMGGGAGMGYIALRFIPYVGLFVGMGLLGFGLALAFYKFNNKPFINIVEAAFNYMQSSRLYVWKRKKQLGANELDLSNFTTIKQAKRGSIPLVDTNKLSDTNWEIDPGETID